MTDRLKKFWNEVITLPLPELEQIKNTLLSKNEDDRLRALLQIRELLKNDLKAEYLELACKQIDDSDNTCRWQAIIVVGEFIKNKPETIWGIIKKYGSSDDADMRSAIATVLLEHFFEINPHLFDDKFKEIKKLVKEEKNQNLLNTLSMCNLWFGSDENNKKVSVFLKRV